MFDEKLNFSFGWWPGCSCERKWYSCVISYGDNAKFSHLKGLYTGLKKLKIIFVKFKNEQVISLVFHFQIL